MSETPVVHVGAEIDTGHYQYTVKRIWIDEEGNTLLRLADGNRFVAKTKQTVRNGVIDDGWEVVNDE